MKTTTIKNLRGFIAALMLAFVVGNAGILAQDNVVALGRIDFAGVPLTTGNTVNGVIASTQNGAGDYTVDVTAAGAFAGTDANDYIVQVAVSSISSGDETIKARVDSVTDDVVSFNVFIDDVEDLTNPDLAFPTNFTFHFVLYRIPETFPATNGTRYLIGTGRVASDGTLRSGAGVGGIAISSVENATGDYEITLSKVGEFADDAAGDYVLALTCNNDGEQDQAVRGGVSDVSGNNEVVFNIHTDDVQDNPDAAAGVPDSEEFHFTVYRIVPPSGTPASKLLLALARVNSAGTLLSAPNAFDGGTLSAAQIGTGHYEVTIVSPGAYAGRSEEEFVAHANLDQNGSADEAIISTVAIADDNTLEITIHTNDVEESGDLDGNPNNAPFFLSLFDAKADLQPDLRIGDKGSLTKMKGNDVYNVSGAMQRLKLGLVSTSRKKYFLALENDGNVADNVRVKETGAGNRVRTNYFRLTGGRVNVTAKVKQAGSIVSFIKPDAIVKFEARVKYLSAETRPARKIRITGRSLVDPSSVDVVRMDCRGI